MLASLFLYVPGIIFEMAVEGLAGFLRLLAITASGVWSSKQDTDVGALFSESHPIPKSDPSQYYDMGYEAGTLVVGRRSSSELHGALRRFVPTARSEYAWGAIDALTDELLKRGEQKPVL